MPRTLQIILRIAGAALVAIAAIHFVIDVVRSMRTEDHATSDGFQIHHTIEVPHTTLLAGLAGGALVGLSFIRGRKAP
ncbi:MAG: hypothetical protein WA269_05125 [Candidatus Udaeobacter sp.]